MLTQKRDRGRKFFAEAVDFFKGAGEAEAGPSGGRDAVMAMQRLAAVVTAADADS